MQAGVARLLGDLLSGDEARAEAAAAKLPARGDEAVDALLPLTASPQREERWWAVRALAECDSPRAGAALAAALADPEPDIRQCATLGLRLHPLPESIPALIDALADEDRLTARLACDALIAAGAAAIPALARASEDPDPAVRIEAVRALSRVGDPAAIGPLFRCLDDPSTMVGHYAEEGLDRLGIGMTFFHP